MRFTQTAADRTTFDAMREVFMQSCRHYEFHANRYTDRTTFDAMHEVFMESCRRYVFHADERAEGFSFPSQVRVIIALCTAPLQTRLRVWFLSQLD